MSHAQRPLALDATRRAFLAQTLKGLAGAGGLLLGAGCARLPSTPNDPSGSEMQNTLEEIGLQAFAQRRMHHTADGYRNPFNPNHRRGLWRFLKWRLFSERGDRALYEEETVRPVDLGRNGFGSATVPALTYVNHASVFVRDGGGSLLLDPIFDGISPLIRDYTPLAAVPEALRRPDVVLMTHGHYDHLDTASLARIHPDATVVAPPGYEKLLRKCGLTNTIVLDWFESCAVEGWQITCLPANHWTMRNPITGPNRSLWAGFGVTTPSGYRICFSGDTAYFNGYDQIGALQAAPYDLAVFNLGAYAPRWFMRHSHLDPAECVTAFQQLGARRLMPIHWGSFRLGDEPVYQPPIDLRAEMTARGLADRLLVLDQGDTWPLA